MKKLFLGVLIVLCGSCSTFRINDTLWYGEAPTEFNGQHGTILSELYFAEDNSVFLRNTVVRDSAMLVEPIFASSGTYSIKGKSLKQGVGVTIVPTHTIVGPALDYKGIITPEGMALCAPDSTVYYYKNVK